MYFVGGCFIRLCVPGMVSVECFPRSPDLRLLKLYLWRYLKAIVCQERYEISVFLSL